MFFQTFEKVVVSMLLTACRILALRCSRDSILSEYTLSFTRPQRKKSSGVKSGDLAGQSISPLLIQLLLSFLDRYSLTVLLVCAGAPSCWIITTQAIVARVVAHCIEASICKLRYEQKTGERNKALLF